MDQKNEDEETNPGAGLIPFGIITIILAAVGIGMTIPYLIAPGILDFSELLTAVGSGYAQDFAMPFIVMAGGGIGVLGGVIAIIGGAIKKRLVGVCALVLVIIGGGMMIGAAAYLDFVLQDTFVRLQQDPRETDFNEKEQSLLDVTSAIFNECCFKRYDPICGSEYNTGSACTAPDYNEGTTSLDVSGSSLEPGERDNQLPILACDDEQSCNADTQYPEIIGTVSGLITNLEELLCICYSDDASYNKIASAIDSLGMCEKLEVAVVRNAANIEIPSTPATFGQLPALVGTTRSELSDLVLDEFAVVGKIYPPEAILGTDQEDIGWSCGLGYAKAVAFAIYLNIEAAAELPLLMSYAMGGGMIFFAVILGLYWMLGGGADDGMYYVEDNKMGQYQA